MFNRPVDDEFETRTPALSWSEEERIFAMTSMPGGRLITSGAQSGEINLYDSRTGHKEYTLNGHAESVLALCVVPQKNLLFSAGADSTIRSWNLETLQNIMVFEGHKGFVVGLHAMESSAETGLFSGSDDRTIKQWNTAGGNCVYTFKGHKGPVNVITCSQTHIFSASSDGLLKVWEMASRRCIRTVEAHRDSIWALCLLTDGRIVSGATDATIKIWENLVQSPNMISELPGHHGKIRKLIAHGPILFSASADAKIKVWNLNSGNLVETLEHHDKQVSSLTLQNNQLCSCGFDRSIARWDVGDLLPVKQHLVHYTPLTCLKAKEQEMKTNTAALKLMSAKRMKDKPWEDVVGQYKTLPINFVHGALDFKVKSSSLSLEVIMYIPFLICFVFFFMVGRPIEDNFYMVTGVEQLFFNPIPGFKLARSFQGDAMTMELTHYSHFLEWTRMMKEELWLNRDEGMRPVIQGQNYLIGAVRFHTKRVTNTSCDLNTDMFPNGTITACYGANSPEDELPYICPFKPCAPNATKLELLGHPPYGFAYSDKGSSVFAQTRTYSAGGYAIDIPFNITADEAAERLNLIDEYGFFDSVATRLIDVEFYTYNPSINMFLGSRYIIEVMPGGSFIPVTRDRGFEIFTFNDTGKLVFEGFFFSFVLYFIILFFLEAKDEFKAKRFLGFIINWWNLMEFVNLSIFVIMYAFRWRWMSKSSALDLATILDQEGFPNDLQEILDLYQYQVWFNAINTVLTFLKLLKYVRLNDRLNILTRTLAACQQSLMGVLLLFVYVVLGFALAANALYGTGLFQYRSIDAAYITLLRTLIGDFDYISMSLETRIWTYVFFWSFQILCLFILLNFLIAVISDGFSDVSQTKSPIPLDVSITKVFKDARFECLPKSIRMKLTLLRHRKTQTGIVKSALYQLTKERKNLVGPEMAEREDYEELDRNKVEIHRDHLMDMIPEDSRGLVTEDFVDEVWKDLAWEYHHEQLAQQGQEAHERESLIHEEVMQALRDLSNSFPLIDSARRRLERQEALLRQFADTTGDL